MKLIKDLLVFHVQTTGTDIERDHILQLGAVLLDKDNLLEKNNFNSYVKVSFLDGTILTHSQQLGIPYEQLRKSPKIAEVLRQFVDTLGVDALLSTNSIQNYLFLRQSFKRNLIPFKYDTHIVDIWSLGYVYVLHYGLKKIPTLQTLANHFNIKIKNPLDSLEQARTAAAVLRKIING